MAEVGAPLEHQPLLPSKTKAPPTTNGVVVVVHDGSTSKYDTFINGGPPTDHLPLLPSSSHDQAADQLCELPCFIHFITAYFTFLTLVGVSVLATIFIRPPGLGILVLGLLPSTCLLLYLQHAYHKSVLRSQMVYTFFEAINWMSYIRKSTKHPMMITSHWWW